MSDGIALFKAVFDAAPDPILIVGSRGRILHANAQAEKVFGYTAAELLAVSIEALVPQRFRGHHAQLRDTFVHAPRTRPMGVALALFACHKDGTEIPVEISLSPLAAADGQLTICIIRDVTTQKKAACVLRAQTDALAHANAGLARSNAELEQFAYAASHDLQEPLRAIASSCQLVQRRYKDKLGPDADEFLGFAIDGAKRMQTLIVDLLAYSRISSRAKSKESADSGELVDQAIANLHATVEASGATVSRDPAMPKVTCDPGQLVQVFQNLVGNGIKFRRNLPPEVHVSAHKEQPHHWRFSVRDNGIGIDPQQMNKLFVIFKRLHRREEYPGTGIGLALAKKIVERHDGRIWMDSLPGQGSTVHFTLPSA